MLPLAGAQPPGWQKDTALVSRLSTWEKGGPGHSQGTKRVWSRSEVQETRDPSRHGVGSARGAPHRQPRRGGPWAPGH